MAEPILDRARAVLARNRASALKFVDNGGRVELFKLLKSAQEELQQRMAAVAMKSGTDTFTHAQMRVTLEQIKLVMIELESGMFTALKGNAGTAAALAAKNTINFIASTNTAFGDMGMQPLLIDEARLLSRAQHGAESSLLRRIGSNPRDPRSYGILKRYGMETVGFFEKKIALGFLQKKRFEQIQQDLINESPFLQAKPRYWAERIFRTEGMAAFNKGSHETFQEMAEQTGDFVKIIVAFFDDRTAADSYATHGQIRRVDETFDTWHGPIMHPPDRPNDRGSMILHRIRWPIPKSLQWKTREEILSAWRREGRKGSPPPRPLMTTVPLDSFGR